MALLTTNISTRRRRQIVTVLLVGVVVLVAIRGASAFVLLPLPDGQLRRGRGRGIIIPPAALFDQYKSPRTPPWTGIVPDAASLPKNDALRSAPNDFDDDDDAEPTVGDLVGQIMELHQDIVQLKYELSQRPLKIPSDDSDATSWYKKLPVWNRQDAEYKELTVAELARMSKDQLVAHYNGKLKRHLQVLHDKALYAAAERDEVRRNTVALRQHLQDDLKDIKGKFDYQVTMRSVERNRAAAELAQVNEQHAREVQAALEARGAEWRQRFDDKERELKDVRNKLQGAETRLAVRGEIITQLEDEKRGVRSYLAAGWSLMCRRVARKLSKLKPPPRATVHSLDELVMSKKKDQHRNE